MHQMSAPGLALTLIVLWAGSYTFASGDQVLHAFLNRAEPVLESYEARRTLVGWSDAFDRQGRLEVRTEFARAARSFRYEILTEEGSAVIRRRALEAVLRAEEEAVQHGRMAESAMTSQNYDMAASGSDENGLHRLLIHPRRRDSLLVRGVMFVTGDGDLIRVEGQLAKRPSFWTTQVDVTREYTRVNGITVLARVLSTAKTRLFGTGWFVMTYTYQSINGQRVVDEEVRDSMRR